MVAYQCVSTNDNHKGMVRGCAFSEDCETVASCGDDKTVRLYAVPSMKETGVLRGHTEQVFTVSFSPDNETLATGGFDNTLQLWNYRTKQKLHSWALGAHVFACDFGPRGFISACGDDMVISIFHVASKKLAATLVGHTSPAFSCDFHPDKMVIISGSHDNTIRVWDQNAAMKDYGVSGQDMRALSPSSQSPKRSASPPKSPRGTPEPHPTRATVIL